MAIMLAPRSHLVRWGGLASASPYRKKIVLRPQVGKGLKFEENEASSEIDTELDKENLKEGFKKTAGPGCYKECLE